ncbi:MAG: hypothetical protein IJY27_01920 [Clostridia bacterium]|nr:hypothetical protein [Clostridia bacterium]
MKKKLIITAICVAAAFILLFPFGITQYNDGGTVSYKSMTYEIIRWHRMYDVYDEATGAGTAYWVNDTDFYIFPFNLCDNVADKEWSDEQLKFVKTSALDDVKDIETTSAPILCEHGMVIGDAGVAEDCPKCAEEMKDAIVFDTPELQKLLVGDWYDAKSGKVVTLRANNTALGYELVSKSDWGYVSEGETIYSLTWSIEGKDQLTITNEKGEIHSYNIKIADGKLIVNMRGEQLELIDISDKWYVVECGMPDLYTEYFDAELAFSISPKMLTVNEFEDGFYIDVTTKIASGRLGYWGSSTVLGAEVRVVLQYDGTELEEMPLDETEDFTFVTLAEGDMITVRHYFTGKLYPGTYDVYVEWYGQQMIFRDAVIITTETACPY